MVSVLIEHLSRHHREITCCLERRVISLGIVKAKWKRLPSTIVYPRFPRNEIFRLPYAAASWNNGLERYRVEVIARKKVSFDRERFHMKLFYIRLVSAGFSAKNISEWILSCGASRCALSSAFSRRVDCMLRSCKIKERPIQTTDERAVDPCISVTEAQDLSRPDNLYSAKEAWRWTVEKCQLW